MSDPFRLYLDPDEIRETDGYPFAWHGLDGGFVAIKDLVRERDGNRCLRCKHPYTKGNELNSHRSEWSPCDMECTHVGPMRVRWEPEEWRLYEGILGVAPSKLISAKAEVQAQWRILTVHHLNGIKVDCRWFNLVSLCQRCHLTIQGKVYMERPYDRPHTEWFKPFAAAYYGLKYMGAEFTREEVDARLDELLDLELRQDGLF